MTGPQAAPGKSSRHRIGGLVELLPGELSAIAPLFDQRDTVRVAHRGLTQVIADIDSHTSSQPQPHQTIPITVGCMSKEPDQPRNLKSRSLLAGQAAASSSEMEDALQHGPDTTAAAFFDVDNTIMQGASIFHLAKGLHRRKFFTTKDIAKAAWQQFYFRFAGVEDPEHIAKARASGLAFIKGHAVEELEEVGEEIFDENMAHKIWPGTRALAQWHLDRGQNVWLVTAAPVEIANTMPDASA